MSKQVLARLAWCTLAFILLAQLVQVPSVRESLRSFESSAFGRGVVVVVLLVWGAVAIGLWLAAMRYSYLRARAGAGSFYTLLALAFTNFIGALVYYFLVVRVHPEVANSDLSAKQP